MHCDPFKCHVNHFKCNGNTDKWDFPGGASGLKKGKTKTCLQMQETQEMQVWSVGREDPLEKGMATHVSILAWRIPWTEEPGGL